MFVAAVVAVGVGVGVGCGASDGGGSAAAAPRAAPARCGAPPGGGRAAPAAGERPRPTYGCEEGELPRVEFVKELGRDRRCTLEGEYSFENLCRIVKALERKGHRWDILFVIPKDASGAGIDQDRYAGPSRGDVAYVNPRARGEVIVHQRAETYYYCVDVSPGLIRFVLKALFLS